MAALRRAPTYSFWETTMATSHFCGGKWRPGSNEECPKHKRLSKKQVSVYRSG